LSDPAPFRCGVVAVLGRPNAGKSTLMNALLGEKVAITSPRAQTTRSRILGVLTRAEGQILFHDTPGVHRGRTRFNLAMTEAALSAARDADVRLLLLDARATWDLPEERVAELGPPILLVRTKVDLEPPAPAPEAARLGDPLEVSAQTGLGLGPLVERILDLLPESPALYPEDYLTDRSMRFLAAERIREVAFEMLRDEVPYSVAVEIEEWREEEALRLRANLLVERESHKGIVVGQGGRMLERLGSEARLRVAELVGKPVHLSLWVKTDRNWSRRLRRVRALGYL
jgi:GTP-binding protein Era